jgi:L-alanine-DL-glutamate epimerase-like enolase superfamily enzyme
VRFPSISYKPRHQAGRFPSAAASLRNLTLLCELGEFERFRNDPSSGLEVNDGFLKAPKKPGLGVDVDLRAIGLME